MTSTSSAVCETPKSPSLPSAYERWVSTCSMTGTQQAPKPTTTGVITSGLVGMTFVPPLTVTPRTTCSTTITSILTHHDSVYSYFLLGGRGTLRRGIWRDRESLSTSSLKVSRTVTM